MREYRKLSADAQALGLANLAAARAALVAERGSGEEDGVRSTTTGDAQAA